MKLGNDDQEPLLFDKELNELLGIYIETLDNSTQTENVVNIHLGINESAKRSDKNLSSLEHFIFTILLLIKRLIKHLTVCPYYMNE